MDRKDIQKALAVVKSSPQRKFKQTYDLVVNLKGLNLKQPEHQVDVFLTLPHAHGREVKMCALIGAELEESAKAAGIDYILVDNFSKYEGNKKSIRQLSEKYDFFIAQATLMAQIAKVFGRVFGPRNKMPNPKGGCVVPPNAALKPLVERFNRVVRLKAKTAQTVQCIVGKEGMTDEQVMDNVMAVYNQLVTTLPQDKNNIKNILLKLTMGTAVTVGETQAPQTKKAHTPKAAEAPAAEAEQ